MNEQAKCPMRGSHMSPMHRDACPVCNPNRTVPELNHSAGTARILSERANALEAAIAGALKWLLSHDACNARHAKDILFIAIGETEAEFAQKYHNDIIQPPADKKTVADAGHQKCVDRIAVLMGLDPEDGSRDGVELNYLATAVELYEKLRYPLGSARDAASKTDLDSLIDLATGVELQHSPWRVETWDESEKLCVACGCDFIAEPPTHPLDNGQHMSYIAACDPRRLLPLLQELQRRRSADETAGGWIETAKQPPTKSDARYYNETVEAYSKSINHGEGVFCIWWQNVALEPDYYTHWRRLPNAPGSPVEPECAHTLVMPESTLTVIDPFKAKCRVCYEFFDLPLNGPPSSVKAAARPLTERERDGLNRAAEKCQEVLDEGLLVPPLNLREEKASTSPGVLDRKVTVCAACLCASCWQGEFYCDKAKGAGTVEKTLRELYEGNSREDSGYWFKDANTGEVDYDAKSAAKRAWLKESDKGDVK